MHPQLWLGPLEINQAGLEIVNYQTCARDTLEYLIVPYKLYDTTCKIQSVFKTR